LARFVTEIVRSNGLSDGLYVEPYAGGAAIAWELLLTGVVREVAINDLSDAVYSFWRCVLDRTDELVKLIYDIPVTMETRDRMKAVMLGTVETDELEFGFAMFFLNRTNRSGILNGGVIGGRDQTGPWKIDARYNKLDLVQRIERIAAARRRISLTRLDAIDFIKQTAASWSKRTLVYLDPPYYTKGRDLYYDFYKHSDHANVANIVQSLQHVNWVVSYDDAPPIHELYEGKQWLQYTIAYSARQRTQGREAMFFSSNIRLPAVQGSMVEIDRWGVSEDNRTRSEPYRRPLFA
jgi:DNA adenine methylase